MDVNHNPQAKTAEMKVSSSTNVNKLASAIAHRFREDVTTLEFVIVGAGALNQAIKAITLASKFLDITLCMVPEFAETDIPNHRALKLTVKELPKNV